MTATEIVENIIAAGGVLALDGDSIDCQIPATVKHLASALREHKPEVIEALRRCGGRIAAFPCCPACGSFALYREHSQGNYECQSCCARGIPETDARRAGAEWDIRHGNGLLQ